MRKNRRGNGGSRLYTKNMKELEKEKLGGEIWEYLQRREKVSMRAKREEGKKMGEER